MLQLKSTQEQFSEFFRETYEKGIRLLRNPTAEDLREINLEELKKKRDERRKKRAKHFGI